MLVSIRVYSSGMAIILQVADTDEASGLIDW